MRVAALDLGSNTTLLLVADVEGKRVTHVVRDETTITRLGQGVHQARRFHAEALVRMDACLQDYAEKITHDRCDKIIAVATSAARDVTNREALLEIGRRHQIPIQIIAGEQEAQLTFKGALAEGEVPDATVVVDVGGGSTEFISRRQNQISGRSVDVGAVRLTELFVRQHPVPEAQVNEVRAYVQTVLATAGIKDKGPNVIAVAGTPTTIAALDLGRAFDAKLIDGYKLSLERLEGWITRLAALSLAERERLPGMEPKRADVIVVGAIILAEGLRALGANSATVSIRGVRYGVASSWQDF